jgi:hypothetical protein
MENTEGFDQIPLFTSKATGILSLYQHEMCHSHVTVEPGLKI